MASLRVSGWVSPPLAFPRRPQRAVRRSMSATATLSSDEDRGGGGGSGGGPGPSPPSAATRWLECPLPPRPRWSDDRYELIMLQQRMTAVLRSMDARAASGDFVGALADRDALLPLQLRERHLLLQPVPHHPDRAPLGKTLLHRQGMVVQHRRHGYKGVIASYSRDGCCLLVPSKRLQCVIDVDLNSLQFGLDAPFFQLLVDQRDRPTGPLPTLVAQEDCLRVADPQPVEHPLIARFFERWSESDRRYIPSILLRAGPWGV